MKRLLRQENSRTDCTCVTVGIKCSVALLMGWEDGQTKTYTEQIKHVKSHQLSSWSLSIYSFHQTSLSSTFQPNSTNGGSSTFGITTPGWIHSSTNTQMVLVQQPQQPEETVSPTLSVGNTHISAQYLKRTHSRGAFQMTLQYTLSAEVLSLHIITGPSTHKHSRETLPTPHTRACIRQCESSKNYIQHLLLGSRAFG